MRPERTVKVQGLNPGPFEGSVQDATVELGDFLRAAVAQFGCTALLPPEINLKAAIDYVAGRVVHNKPAQGAVSTELSVAGAFTLTAANSHSVRIAFYADTVQGAAVAPYVLGAAFDVDLPLSRLLSLYVAATQRLFRAQQAFLGTEDAKMPYIIGVGGSVAVGKSTTARVLQALLTRWPNVPKVDLITTDGFLFPNAVL